MSDFSSLMAQMIAQAKPQAAPSGNRPLSIPNPYMAKEQTFQAQVNIPSAEQVDSVKRIFTGQQKPDVELANAQLAHSLWAKLSEDNPEQAGMYLNNPNVQQNLKKWASLGYGGVYQKAGDYFEFLPKKSDPKEMMETLKLKYYQDHPDAQAREFVRAPTEGEITSGMAGEQPRQKYVETAQQARVPSAGEITGKQEMEYPQFRRDLISAETELRKAEAGYHAEMTKLAPEEQRRKTRESAAQSAYYYSMAKQADANAVKLKAESKERLSPEAKAGLLMVERDFDNAWSAWSGKNSYLDTRTSEANAFRAIVEMEGMAQSHVSGVLNYTGDPKYATRSVSRLFSLVDQEFQRPAASRSYLGFSGKPVADQLARRKYYVKTGIDMMKRLDGLPEREFTMLRQWAKAIGMTDDDLARTLMGQSAAPQRQAAPVNEGEALNIPGRADGGPVRAGNPYVVGEKGPEVMVPEKDGVVQPMKSGGDDDDDTKKAHEAFSKKAYHDEMYKKKKEAGLTQDLEHHMRESALSAGVAEYHMQRAKSAEHKRDKQAKQQEKAKEVR